MWEQEREGREKDNFRSMYYRGKETSHTFYIFKIQMAQVNTRKSPISFPSHTLSLVGGNQLLSISSVILLYVRQIQMNICSFLHFLLAKWQHSTQAVLHLALFCHQFNLEIASSLYPEHFLISVSGQDPNVCVSQEGTVYDTCAFVPPEF